MPAASAAEAQGAIGRCAGLGPVGDLAHPDWLTLQVASGGVAVSGKAVLVGSLVAPGSAVALSGDAELRGSLVADKLSIAGNAVLVQAP